MVKLTAIFRSELNGALQHTTCEYFNSKSKFGAELRSNGFRVVEIFTDEEIKEAKSIDKRGIRNKIGYRQDFKFIAYDYAKEIL